MLRRVGSLKDYAIQATDGELGKIREMYFDEEQWAVRYLVVDTGKWLTRHEVLISPYSVDGIDDEHGKVLVSLTREQVENSPDIDTHQPLSRQLEGEFSAYYGYGHYWTGPYLWGADGAPVMPLPNTLTEVASAAVAEEFGHAADTHLRSSAEVHGYHIAGTDDAIGHVADFIFDDETWALRYLLVDTHNWWPGGKKVLLAPEWIEHIDWADALVKTRLTREEIRNSPEYVEELPIARDYEKRLHEHYRRQGYWDV
ncbi:PRC-barrel domain containing protein [Pusillimonas sp. TS35]|uniref:PRC-barrel domain-containing protein n=1 Tax=Paracandidimonas lactea TaxID=2895524 RepID=UPI00136C0FBE|nr:PRC-barrel domain-containing protein [Paracandidimonas lactea]MYN12161.1 PRC-barrel domain containing protein [Pusillimonas sp. TS35]